MLPQLQLQLSRLPAWLRDCLALFAFLAITAVMTWPFVTRLRDAVADTGDSYAFAWGLWWNYHQTFTDPLNLFQANIFFPYSYTLAFTEHGYGVSLLFFPLLAAGLRPLTVYSVATFVAFAFSGYGAFRLTRTLTGSYGAAWVAGIVFAFIPYHFLFMTALPYLFTGWIPLLLEALVLFVRVRSWQNAAWLGFVFLMNGLTCTNWFFLALVPFLLSGALLLIRYPVARERAFWTRSLVSLAIATLLLLPFMWPYYSASKLYGFKRDAEEVTRNSASWVDWVTAPGYNRVWDGMGRGLPGVKATLFTGILPLLLALAAIFLINSAGKKLRRSEDDHSENGARRKWIYLLDGLSVVAGLWAIVAAGFAGTPPTTAAGAVLHSLSSDRALMVLTIALVARCCISYPQFLKHRLQHRNLLESLRSESRSDAFWLGMIWAAFGFVCSFGMKLFFYRVLFDFFLPFQSIRAPYRAGMICFVGLSILAGLGAIRLGELVAEWRPTIKSWATYSVLVAALLFELHAAPLPFARGAVFPDEVTLKLKATPMRGGVVDLPSIPGPPNYSWHLSMLRAADHGKPVVFAASSFIPPITIKVHEMTKGPGIPKEFLDLLEEIPASYVVVHRGTIVPERQEEFAAFFAEGVASGRLRMVGTYGQGDDLYAVTKTEPNAR